MGNIFKGPTSDLHEIDLPEILWPNTND